MFCCGCDERAASSMLLVLPPLPPSVGGVTKPDVCDGSGGVTECGGTGLPCCDGDIGALDISTIRRTALPFFLRRTGRRSTSISSVLYGGRISSPCGSVVSISSSPGNPVDSDPADDDHVEEDTSCNPPSNTLSSLTTNDVRSSSSVCCCLRS